MGQARCRAAIALGASGTDSSLAAFYSESESVPGVFGDQVGVKSEVKMLPRY